MKKGLGIVGSVLLIGAYVAWQFLGADVQIKIKEASGTSWNDSRAELTSKFTKALTAPLSKMVLPQDTIPKIVTCLVDKAIPVLNKSGCSYLYNTATSSRAKHERRQTACLNRVGYVKTEAKLTQKCMQKYLPNTWKIHRRALAATMAKAAPATVPNKAAWGSCTANKILGALSKTSCLPINKDPAAKKPINSIDDCVKQEGLMKILPSFGRDCLQQQR
ncbi:MAG: hypothetical protein KAI66_26705 [Lentisphaeria bacterium]|nr:hypothetical protein [Lentisphaeria bacterium]